MVAMTTIRTGLGQHAGMWGNPAHALDKEETILFYVRLGTALGFEARREVGPVRYKRRGQWTQGRIDVVWYCRRTGQPFCAIEVEGRDVAKDSMRNDAEKFRVLGAPHNLIALFQIDNDGTPKGTTGARHGYTARVSNTLRTEGHVVPDLKMDVDVFREGGAESWAEVMLTAYRSWNP